MRPPFFAPRIVPGALAVTCRLALALAALAVLAVLAVGACGLDTQGSLVGKGSRPPNSGSGSAGAGGSGAGGGTSVGGSAGVGGEVLPEAGGGGQGGAPVTDWWDDAFPMRAGIRVQAGAAAVPTGYSIALKFDHKALFDAGQSLETGEDVRVVWKDGDSLIELDRQIDPGSKWARTDTTIWWKAQAPIPANAADTSYFLYYGAKGGDAADPPNDGSKIHLFYDDFESGNLGQWTVHSGQEWSVEMGETHRGMHAMRGAPVSGSTRWATAKGVYEADMAMEAYWYVTALSNFDVAQGVRASGVLPVSQYETNFEGNDGGWDIAKIISGSWSEVQDQPGGQSPMQDTWVRITTIIAGTKMKVLREGAQIVPSSGWTEVGGELEFGTGALRLYRVPSGQAFRVDDVIIRRYVDPEPTATLTEAEPIL